MDSPSDDAPTTVSALLDRWRRGDARAVEELLPLVYGGLRQRARQLLAHRPAQTLTPTALVHEAFVKLVEGRQANWADRDHFFAVSALAMRQVLLDGARRRMADKRGGGRRPETLDEMAVRVEERAADLVSLDAALERLRARDPGLARVVDLVFFEGLTYEEAGRVLGVSESTAKRTWRLARAFLHRELVGRPLPRRASIS